MFSHDELIITITQQSQSIKTAIWCVASRISRKYISAVLT